MESELNALDRLVLDWCVNNGWDTPQKINGVWWAIAPSRFVPEPVSISYDFNKTVSSISLALGESQSFVRAMLVEIVEQGTLRRAMAGIAAQGNIMRALTALAEQGGSINKIADTNHSFRLSPPRSPLPFPFVLSIPPSRFSVMEEALEADTPSEPESVKSRDKRNQAMMRSFLGSKFPRPKAL
jgi:hypothetical protein